MRVLDLTDRCATGIVTMGTPSQSWLHRTLIGPSLGSCLACHATLPVLYMPSAQVVRPARPHQVPGCFQAVQAQTLLSSPSLRRYSAHAA